MSKTVSTKDLRLRMAEVKKSLQNGVSILWIDHSQPIAKIIPIDRSETSGEDWFEKMERLRFSPQLKKKLNAVNLIRKERE